MNYDEKKGLVILEIDSDAEGILNDVLILIEKNIPLKKYKDGIEVKIDAVLKLDFINEKLLVTF